MVKKPTNHMTLFEHLIALKMRLIWSLLVFVLAFGVCYYFAADIYRFLLQPLADYYLQKGEQRTLIYTGLSEAFFTYVTLAFYSALLISLPFFLCQLYLFLAPGLFRQEKLVVIPYLIITPLLFVCGIIFVYRYIFPMAWSFFLSFETPQISESMPIRLEPRVSEYLSLVTQLILVFGLAFQLPVILTLLIRIGLLSVQTLIDKRRFAIIAIFMIAAIVTPPDAFSQIGLAFVLILLYELSIMAGKMISRTKKVKYARH